MSEKLFPISRPFGYHPDYVNRAILAYNNVIRSKDAKIAELERTLNLANSEIKRMTLEMSMLEIPDTSEIQEKYLIDKFKEHNHKNHPERFPEENLESEENIEIPEEIKENLDNMSEDYKMENQSKEELYEEISEEDMTESDINAFESLNKGFKSVKRDKKANSKKELINEE